MNEATAWSIDLFKANAEIDRLYQQIQILIVDDVKNKQKISLLEQKLKSYLDKYGEINE